MKRQSFSTRCVDSPGAAKRLREIFNNKLLSSKIEQKLLYFLVRLEKRGYPIKDLYRIDVQNIKTKKINKKEIEDMMTNIFLQDDEILFQKDSNCTCGTTHNSPTTYISFNLGNINQSPQQLPGRPMKCSSSTKFKKRSSSSSSRMHDGSFGQFSFHSDDSFIPIATGPPLIPQKPNQVPSLDFKKINTESLKDD